MVRCDVPAHWTVVRGATPLVDAFAIEECAAAWDCDGIFEIIEADGALNEGQEGAQVVRVHATGPLATRRKQRGALFGLGFALGHGQIKSNQH